MGTFNLAMSCYVSFLLSFGFILDFSFEDPYNVFYLIDAQSHGAIFF